MNIPTTEQLFERLTALSYKQLKVPKRPLSEKMQWQREEKNRDAVQTLLDAITTVRNPGRLVYTSEEVLEAVGDAQVVIIDTETSSLRPHRDGKILAGIGFRALDGEGVYLSVRHQDSKNVPVKVVLAALDALRGRTMVFHNPKFDLAVLFMEGINLIEEDILDTVVLMRLVFEDHVSYDLKELGAIHVRSDAKAGETELKALRKRMGWETYNLIPANLILQYALMDLDLTAGLYRLAMKVLTKRATEDEGVVPYTLMDLMRLEQKVTRTLFRTECLGFLLDRDFINKEAKDVNEIKTQLGEECYELAGIAIGLRLNGDWDKDAERRRLEVYGELGPGFEVTTGGWLPRLEFNIGSPHDIKKIFHAMGMTSSLKTEKGAESWGKVALEKLDHSLASAIIQYRAVDMVSRYYLNFKTLMGEDNVVHGSFHQAGTKSGRLSCREPNLQNIPRFEGFTGSKIGAQQTMEKVRKAREKRLAAEIAKDAAYEERGRERIGFDEETAEALTTGESSALFGRVRGAFVPREGHYLFMCDWSQIELRIFAEYAGEEELLHAFDLGLDIHRLTALAAYGQLPEDEESLLFKWVRNMGKQIAFGLLYGMGTELLAAEIDKTEDEAQGFMDAYFERFKNARKFIDGVLKQVLVRGGHNIFWREGCNPKCPMCLEASEEAGRGVCVKGCKRCRPGWYCYKNCDACRGGAAGWVRNKYGRRRYLTKGLRYKSINFLVQGTAADLLKEAMVRTELVLDEGGFKTKMISTVHDELIFEIPYDETDQVVPVIIAAMSESERVKCRLRVDVAWSPTRWSEKKALKCKDCDGAGLICNKPKDQLLRALYENDKAYMETASVVDCKKCSGSGYDLNPIHEFEKTGVFDAHA